MALFGGLSLLACGSIVSAATINTLASTTAATTTPTFTQAANYTGATSDGFEAYSGPDPTNGHVNYTNMITATSLGLVGFGQYADQGKDTHAYIGVDMTNVAPVGRNSVRLTSMASFSVGMLVVFDVHHVPTAFGVCPLPGSSAPAVSGQVRARLM